LWVNKEDKSIFYRKIKSDQNQSIAGKL